MTPRSPLLPLILAILAASAAPAAAAELVAGQAPAPTLADAVKAAHAGDTIRVRAGVYHAHIVLNKPLTLIGEGRPTLDGDGRDDVLLIRAPGCHVSGFHITHSGAEVLSENAAVRVESDNNTLDDLTIDNSLYGIFVTNARGNQLHRNTVLGLTRLWRNDRGDAIRLHNASRTLVEDNDLSEGRDGIYFNSSDANTIRRNRIAHVRYGLHYMYSNDNLFEDNTFTDAEAGAALMFSHGIHLRRNVFEGSRGYRAYGLLLKDNESCTVENNLLAGNRTGLFMDASLNTRVSGNRLVGNDVAFEIRGSAEGNTFEGNTVAGNSSAIALPTGNSENTWRHNYWSDYRGYDLDGDGVGDVPHHAGDVFGYVSENLPPARLFLLSPGFQALEFAERTVPMIDNPQVVDEAPAMRPPTSGHVPADPARKPAQHGFALLAGAFVAAGLLPLLLARKAFQ